MKNKKKYVLSIIYFLLGFSSLSAQTWTAIKQITWGSYPSETPVLSIDSQDNLHLVWVENLSPPELIPINDSIKVSNFEIFFKKSTDAGSSWGTTTRLTWTADQSMYPQTAVDSNDYLHLVWEDRSSGNAQIYYKKSTNGGTTWSAPLRLTWTINGCYKPTIAIDTNDNIHVVFYENNYEIYYKRSTNGGVTWDSIKRLTWTPGFNLDPDVTPDFSGYIYVVWTDDTPGNDEIFSKRSVNSGTTFDASQRLTWSSQIESTPRIAADKNYIIHLIYQKNLPENIELYYKKSSNMGASWNAPLRLTWTSNWSFAHDFKIDSNDYIHMTWVEIISENREIFYRKSTNSGSSWETAQRLTWNPARSDEPSLAIDSSDNIHIIWRDEKTGNSQLFHKKGF